MENNKPKYHFFKNTQYALEGFIHAFKTETSFKIEFFLAFLVIPAIFLSPFELWMQMILFCSYFLIMIVELLNSAVENVVDLVTKDIHPLAKSAKDIGATAVMFSIGLHVSCWGIFIIG